MGTSYTDTHRLVKPDDNESIDVEHLNSNWNLIDKILPLISLGEIPEGKTPKIWMGKVVRTQGAGGENRTEPNATNFNGHGGIWFGYDGVPTFEGIAYADVGEAGNAEQYAAKWVIEGLNTTRIKIRGRRMHDNSLATGYASYSVFLIVAGW